MKKRRRLNGNLKFFYLDRGSKITKKVDTSKQNQGKRKINARVIFFMRFVRRTSRVDTTI